MLAGLGSGEEAISKFIQVVGKIQLLAVIKLKSSLPGWLSTKGHSPLLEACDPSVFKLAECIKSFLCF